QLSGPLCDAVLADEGSAETLESLARSNLFLVPLDDYGEWYRYHHLFQELLRAELTRSDPDSASSLLSRAAEWCEANGQPEAAIRYAQEAGDVDTVGRLVAAWAQPAYQSGRLATARKWVAWVEDEGGMERNAAAAVLGALLSALHGRPGEAARGAEAADRAPYEGALVDGSASIDSWRALLNTVLCRGGLTAMVGNSELAARSLGPRSQFLATALCGRGVAALL